MTASDFDPKNILSVKDDRLILLDGLPVAEITVTGNTAQRRVAVISFEEAIARIARKAYDEGFSKGYEDAEDDSCDCCCCRR